MGWTYEVQAFVPIGDPMNGQYEYVQFYTGNSLLAAIRMMRKAKKFSGCVKLEWR